MMDPGRMAETGAAQSISVLSETLLGAITIVSLCVAGVCVWQLLRAQEKLREEYKGLLERNEKLVDRMISAFSGMKGTLTSLTEAEKRGQDVLQSLKSSLDGMKHTVDLLLLSRGNSHERHHDGDRG